VSRLPRADAAGFVGRRTELEALAEVTRQERGLRLAVVTGAAGAGKTSLVLRFAYQIRSQFPGGDVFVDLRGYDSGPPLATLDGE
jgi:Cdc6-like AAA superfamily ATPase